MMKTTKQSSRKAKRYVIEDLRKYSEIVASAEQGLAIRHTAFDCLVYIENLGPGIVLVKPEGSPAKPLSPEYARFVDARQEVLVDVIDGDTANPFIQAESGGTVGLSQGAIAYFKRMNRKP